MGNLIERLSLISTRFELKNIIKKYVMGILYGRITDAEISFLIKIRKVLNRRGSDEDDS